MAHVTSLASHKQQGRWPRWAGPRLRLRNGPTPGLSHTCPRQGRLGGALPQPRPLHFPRTVAWPTPALRLGLSAAQLMPRAPGREDKGVAGVPQLHEHPTPTWDLPADAVALASPLRSRPLHSSLCLWGKSHLSPAHWAVLALLPSHPLLQFQGPRSRSLNTPCCPTSGPAPFPHLGRCLG